MKGVIQLRRCACLTSFCSNKYSNTPLWEQSTRKAEVSKSIKNSLKARDCKAASLLNCQIQLINGLTDMVSVILEGSRHMKKGYLSHRQTAKAQASLHIRAVSPEPLLFAHTIKGVRGSFRQTAIALSGWTCAFEGFQTAQR